MDRMAGMTGFIPTKVLEAGKLVEDVKRCLNCSDTGTVNLNDENVFICYDSLSTTD